MAPQKKRRTQAERTEASDKAMFRAAIKLIAREGPSHMTLAKLGKEAGFSGGLVSYRFGSKSNLLKATAERILDSWTERVVGPGLAEETGGLAGLEKMAKLYFESVVAKADLMVAQYRLMNESYSSYKELQPAFREFDTRIRGNIVNMLKPAQKAGEIKKNADLNAFATLYIGMLRGVAVQYFIDSKGVDIDAAYKMLEKACDELLLP